MYTFKLFCLQGYQGMVDGGDNIQLAEWKTVSNILNKVSYFVSLHMLALLLFIYMDLKLQYCYIVQCNQDSWL